MSLSASQVRKLDWNSGNPGGTRGLHSPSATFVLRLLCGCSLLLLCGIGSLWCWLLPAERLGLTLPEAKRMCTWHSILPFSVWSKTTLVNIFLRGHGIIPTPPPRPVNIARCLQFRSGPWNPRPGTSFHSWPDTNKGMKPEGSPASPAVEQSPLGIRLKVPSVKWSL